MLPISFYRRVLCSVGLIALALLSACTPEHSVPQDAASPAGTNGTLLNIATRGEARRVPDIATISTGVTTRAADANTAMRSNAERTAKVLAAMTAAGIEETDVHTSGLSLLPYYRHEEAQIPRIVAYEVGNTMTVVIRDLTRLDELLRALASAGANPISDPRFDVERREEALDEARRKAVERAWRRAETYAGKLGMKIRRVVSINELGGSAPTRASAMGARANGDDIRTAPGENTLSVNLDVVFELGS